MPSSQRSRRHQPYQADDSTPALPPRDAVERACGWAHLQAALGQALRSVDALDLLVAEVGQPAEWAGGVRQGDAPHLMGLIAEHLSAQLEAGESLHPLKDQRIAILRRHRLDGTERRCERLLVELRRPLACYPGRHIVPEVTLGAAHFEAGTDPADGLRRALAALQTARTEGSGAVVWHRPVVDDYLRLRRQLLHDLPEALRRAQLNLVLEPAICLRTGAVVGGRAQLRWPHPRLGQIEAAELSALAREAGKTPELELCAVPLTLEHLRNDIEAGSRMPVTIGLSAATLVTDFFAERLRDVRVHAGVQASLLRIELRQEGLRPDQDLLRQRVHELSETGVEAVIGDVNRWHMPLQHLLGIPLAGVECSVAWAREQLSEPRSRSALGALVRVGHALGGSVGASGADTAEELAWLRELRFDHARGAACGHPMLPADFVAYAHACNARASRIDPYSI
jgi:EAL domain-containing protein (putative c-di-GMP-specific phosphodiesterase class I)